MSIHPHSPSVIGDEFGTRSGHTVVVRVADGGELGSAITVYAHAVVDRRLQAAGALPPEWTLQLPSDCVEVLRTTVPRPCAPRAHVARTELLLTDSRARRAHSPMASAGIRHYRRGQGLPDSG
jgi:L-ribulokinase